VHPVIREGNAAQELIHLSRDNGADLIVMRTHGSSGLERAVFGSVTEEVLSKSGITLVVMPAAAGLLRTCANYWCRLTAHPVGRLRCGQPPSRVGDEMVPSKSCKWWYQSRCRYMPPRTTMPARHCSTPAWTTMHESR
jgi:Universal stress protein family